MWGGDGFNNIGDFALSSLDAIVKLASEQNKTEHAGQSYTRLSNAKLW